jgi:hypothetical protein
MVVGGDKGDQGQKETGDERDPALLIGYQQGSGNGGGAFYDPPVLSGSAGLVAPLPPKHANGRRALAAREIRPAARQIRFWRLSAAASKRSRSELPIPAAPRRKIDCTSPRLP